MEHPYSKCWMFKKEREKWYFFIDVGDTAVCLNYSGTLSIRKLLNLKNYFTLYHERLCQFIFECMNKVKWLAVNLIKNIKVFLYYKTVTQASLLIGTCFQTINLKTVHGECRWITVYLRNKKGIWKYRFIQKNNCMLHARNKQRFGNNYMMIAQTMYFSTSLDDDADRNGTSELMLLITDMTIVEEIKNRVRSGNACYHSVQNLLSSRLLSKNLNIKIYRVSQEDFGRVFLMLKYTDITQNTYIQSWTVMEIMAKGKCSLLAVPRTAPVQLTHSAREGVLKWMLP